MGLDVLFVITRTIERLAIVLIGGASLWMGWQLFLRLQLEAQQGEISYKEISIKLQRIGPGIFFAAFGTILLGLAIYQLPTFENLSKISDGENSESGSIKVMLAGESNVVDNIKVLNIAYTISEIPLDQRIPLNLRESLEKNSTSIVVLREKLLIARFGKMSVDLWKKYQSDLRNGLKTIPADVKARVNAVDEAASGF